MLYFAVNDMLLCIYAFVALCLSAHVIFFQMSLSSEHTVNGNVEMEMEKI